MPTSPGRVVVAMSGGVDSSVAAMLLARQGYEVIGVTLRLYAEERSDAAPLSRGCCTLEDIDDARRVCAAIGARHYVINAEREFRAAVIDHFLAEYERGRTPHPCIACNDMIKFSFLLDRALAMDADAIATGHYARAVRGGDGTVRLLKAVDPAKDQSYAALRSAAGPAPPPAAARRRLREVRAARSGPRGWPRRRRQARQPGHLLHPRRRLPSVPHPPPRARARRHRRHGRRGARRAPGRRPLHRRPAPRHRHCKLRAALRRAAGARGPPRRRWAGVGAVRARPCRRGRQLGARRPAGRSGGRGGEDPLQGGRVARRRPSRRSGGASVWFAEPQRAVTPGQAAVFYAGDELLGGGFIAGPLSRHAGAGRYPETSRPTALATPSPSP